MGYSLIVLMIGLSPGIEKDRPYYVSLAGLQLYPKQHLVSSKEIIHCIEEMTTLILDLIYL